MPLGAALLAALFEADGALDGGAAARDAEAHGAAFEVHAGIGAAAEWLFAEAAPALHALASAGFEITVVGHSLGGAAAALLATLLRARAVCASRLLARPRHAARSRRRRGCGGSCGRR